MINRQELKARGKAAFKKAYWMCVLVCLVVALLTGSFGNSNGRNNNNNNDNGYHYAQNEEAVSSIVQADGLLPGVARYQASSIAGNLFGFGGKVIQGVLSGLAGVLVLLFACVGILFQIFISGPVTVGGKRFFLENRERKSSLNAIGFGFKNSYGNVVRTMFKRGLFIFLWTLLLVVPGIIKSFEYLLVPYLLAENPQMDSRRALALSSKLMYGHKSEAFVLGLSFLGWYLLSAITGGVFGIFWTTPYFSATEAELYSFLRGLGLQANLVEGGELPGFGDGVAASGAGRVGPEL